VIISFHDGRPDAVVAAAFALGAFTAFSFGALAVFSLGAFAALGFAAGAFFAAVARGTLAADDSGFMVGAAVASTSDMLLGMSSGKGIR
jgi:hypothetical protein